MTSHAQAFGSFSLSDQQFLPSEAVSVGGTALRLSPPWTIALPLLCPLPRDLRGPVAPGRSVALQAVSPAAARMPGSLALSLRVRSCRSRGARAEVCRGGRAGLPRGR